MTDFDAIAGALRGEALRETAAELFAALSGSAGGAAAAAGFGGEDAETARGGLGFAPGGAAARREVGAARFAAEGVPAQAAAEMAEVRRGASAELGGFGGAVYGAAVEGSGGGAARREVRSRTVGAASGEGFGAEALSEAVRRDSRRYDRRLE